MAVAAPQPRQIGAVNWLGLWTLYQKEVRRFFKVSFQTVFAPMVSTLLFLVVFKLALGAGRPSVQGVPFADFLAPGLIMMAILNNAFANSSSSVIVAKVQGNIVDVLMPPISPLELTAAYVVGAMTRGLIVGAATLVAMAPLADVTPIHPFAALYFAVMASVMFGAVGAIGGVWADKFDHLAAVTNFVIVPMIFLSGTFYSVSVLPPAFRALSQANPVFYLIDGFRYGLVGVSDAPLAVGAAVTAIVTAAAVGGCYAVFATGYKLRT